MNCFNGTEVFYKIKCILKQSSLYTIWTITLNYIVCIHVKLFWCSSSGILWECQHHHRRWGCERYCKLHTLHTLVSSVGLPGFQLLFLLYLLLVIVTRLPIQQLALFILHITTDLFLVVTLFGYLIQKCINVCLTK